MISSIILQSPVHSAVYIISSFISLAVLSLVAALKPSHPRTTQKYSAPASRHRRGRRKCQCAGGKSQRIGPLLREEIIYLEIIVEGGGTLQHTMSGDAQQVMLNYKGQEVLARVNGPTELGGVGKMVTVFIGEERIYVHERVLQNMVGRDMDAFSRA